MKDHQASRRQFIRGLAVGGLAASGALTLSACGGGGGGDDGRFEHGVASGDPLADRVILWTRVTSGQVGNVEVHWEIARDQAFTQLVGEGSYKASSERDYTVKVDATGLTPATNYWYRFRCGDTLSPVGRTRTLPSGGASRVRLAVFSCSNYPAGHFHAYADAARLGDIDVAVHLGDYLYEYGRGGYASAQAAAMGREVLPAGELLSLGDYRQRYAQYHTDADLQALHAAMPMIAVWDDHEIANDTWKDGAENHDPASEGSFSARRAAALQAWQEWLPVRLPNPSQPDRIWRSFNFGGLLALHMLDTRVHARDRQLDYADYMGAGGAFDAAAFSAAMANPARGLLGSEQQNWLQGALAASSATWQVLGQQVLMGRMNLPAPVAMQQIGFSAYAALVAKAQNAPDTLTAQEQAILAQPAIPYNLDAWDGYPVARETLFATARALNKDLVVLSGDTHNAWASNLLDMQGQRVGVELATPGVSSPGLEEYLPNENPAAVAAGVTQLIDPLVYANTGDRGYMVVTATPDKLSAEWRFVSSVKTASYTVRSEKTLSVLPGARQLSEA